MAANRKSIGILGRICTTGAAAFAASLYSGAGAAAAPMATLATDIPATVASHSATLLGAVAPDSPMHLAISLPQRNVPQLDALLRDIYNPRSPNFRHYLTVAAFADRFSPTSSDYEAAAAFFKNSGLTVEARTPNRLLIDVGGSAADIERVFHVTLGMYQHPTENRAFMAPDRPPTLDLALPIQQVIGLDDFVHPTTKLVHASQQSVSRGIGSGPGGDFTGSDMRKAYYPQATLTGAGQSIGLMELSGYNIADVQSFFSNGYGPANAVSIVGIKTDSLSLSCTGNCDDSEQVLDIEYAISIAPGLASVRVYVGKIPEDVLNSMASDNISKVLSTSWGWKKNIATDEALFKEFAAQGQTNLTASGDYSSLSASGPWPEEDPNIVAVGGTDVATSSAGGPWSSETGWNGSAGGPSTDKTLLIASYQKPFVNATNKASKTLRNVPDIAANADTDMYICADGSCGGGNGGTSFASPMWAGIVALANQQAVAAGKPVVGFINPAVYAIAGSADYKSDFHDQTSGKSGKFNCTASYDLVTGLGSPQGKAFIDALVNQ